MIAGVPPKKSKREFDFSRYQKRYIALNVAYQGFDYYGFARQEGIKETIEEEIFAAVRKTCLVPDGKSWKEMFYSRGGRTDKGVSAAGQVVALEVRSRALVGEEPCSEESELDYPCIINRVLSSKIRVVGWKTVDRSFSARFSAKNREYKYFFVDHDCGLNLSAMKEAANFLVGEHDFRNFCKADVPTVTNFIRSILSVSVKRAPFEVGSFSIIELHISGTAFLWHQVRNIYSSERNGLPFICEFVADQMYCCCSLDGWRREGKATDCSGTPRCHSSQSEASVRDGIGAGSTAL